MLQNAAQMKRFQDIKKEIGFELLYDPMTATFEELKREVMSVGKMCNPHPRWKRVWVKCVTRTRVGKPALEFYASLKNILGSKINAVNAQK